MWQVAQVGTNMSRVVSVSGGASRFSRSLGLEHHAMLGLLVDFDLRVVGTHVALGAGAGQPREWTELVWRVWQAVQVPMVPSALGRPTLWH